VQIIRNPEPFDPATATLRGLLVVLAGLAALVAFASLDAVGGDGGFRSTDRGGWTQSY